MTGTATKSEIHEAWLARLTSGIPEDWPVVTTIVSVPGSHRRAAADWTSPDEQVTLTASHRPQGTAEASLAGVSWRIDTDDFPATALVQAALVAARNPHAADVADTSAHIGTTLAASGWTVEEHGDTLLRERCWISPDGLSSVAWCPDHSGDPDSWFVNRPGLRDQQTQAVADEQTPAPVLLTLAGVTQP